MSVSNHDYKEQFNARFEAEKEARQWESKYTDLLKRVREAYEETRALDVILVETDGFEGALTLYKYDVIDLLKKHLPELEEK